VAVNGRFYLAEPSNRTVILFDMAFEYLKADPAAHDQLVVNCLVTRICTYVQRLHMRAPMPVALQNGTTLAHMLATPYRQTEGGIPGSRKGRPPGD
jgi:hypothetical protein